MVCRISRTNHFKFQKGPWLKKIVLKHKLLAEFLNVHQLFVSVCENMSNRISIKTDENQ